MQAQPSARIVAIVRDASWMTPDRAVAYGRILFGTMLVMALCWVGLSRGGLDPSGKPLGTDFLSFWAAGRLAAAGTPALVYVPSIHAATEAAVFRGADPGYYAFFYPPMFLLPCRILAAFPWGIALPLWLSVTGLAYWWVVRAVAGSGWSSTLAILAFPAVLLTVGHGQNAFLTTALFGGGILAMDRRPILAGVLFGLLVIKPQLGLLIPLVLVATGAWTTMLAAAGTVLALALASLLAFGPEVGPAFVAAMPLTREALEQNLLGAEKMQSVFAAVQVLHGSTAVAYVAQGSAALAAAGCVIALARTRPGSQAIGPALVVASLLTSPFLFDYDLTLLAVPLAWMMSRARSTGFLPWEKAGLMAAFVLPLVSRALALHAGLPLGPAVIAVLLILVVRRGLADPARAHGAAREPRREPWSTPGTAQARQSSPPSRARCPIAAMSSWSIRGSMRTRSGTTRAPARWWARNIQGRRSA